MREGKALTEWRSYWPLVLTGLMGTTTTGAHVYSLGVVMKPLAAEYGWSRAEIAFAITITSGTAMCLLTFVGILVDRLGPRRVALAGVPLTAAMMTLVVFAGPSIWSWFGIWFIYGLAVMLMHPVVYGPAIASAFNASRGMALGIGLAGSGIASLVYPSLTLWLLITFGLGGVYPGLALFTLLTMGPLVLFAFKPPAVHAGAKASSTIQPGEPPDSAPAWGMTLREAIRNSLFWRIVLTMAISAMTMSGINIHLVSLLTDGGRSTAWAVGIVAVIGPAVLVGRLLGGYLLDRVHARWIAMTFLLLPALGCILLVSFTNSFLLCAAAAAFFGLSKGVEGDLLPYALARYFGLRHFGALYGLAMAIFSGGYATGPLAAGIIYDLTGSYQGALIGISAALLVAGLVTVTFPRYPAERAEAQPV